VVVREETKSRRAITVMNGLLSPRFYTIRSIVSEIIHEYSRFGDMRGKRAGNEADCIYNNKFIGRFEARRSSSGHDGRQAVEGN